MIVVGCEIMRWKIKVQIKNYSERKATFLNLFPTEQNLVFKDSKVQLLSNKVVFIEETCRISNIIR